MQRMSFVALCFPTKHYTALGSDICALSLCGNGQDCRWRRKRRWTPAAAIRSCCNNIAFVMQAQSDSCINNALSSVYRATRYCLLDPLVIDEICVAFIIVRGATNKLKCADPVSLAKTPRRLTRPGCEQ